MTQKPAPPHATKPTKQIETKKCPICKTATAAEPGGRCAECAAKQRCFD